MERREKLPPVFITGARGFIGRRLARRLRAAGHRVLGIDTSERASLGRSALPHDFVVQGDVCRIEDLDRLVPEGAWVFHLASVVGVVEVLARARECFETSVKGSEMICKIAQERGCRLLFTSSSEVYGNGRFEAMAEEDPLPQSYGPWPRAAYPQGKRLAEKAVLRMCEEGGDGRVARLFNVSGPGQSWKSGMVLPTFVHHAQRGMPLPLLNKGQDRRCFQHVDDAVESLCLLMAKDEACGKIVNIGGNQTILIRELAERVQSLTGRLTGRMPQIVEQSSVTRYGGPSARCAFRLPSLLRCEALLGPLPRSSLDKIITDLADFLSTQTQERGPCAESLVS